LSTSEPKASRAKVHLAAPDRLIWLVVGGIVLWGVWAFGSELMLNLRLNHEVQSLRQGNAQLAASNDQTQKELAVGGSPSAMEEAARKAGFARPQRWRLGDRPHRAVGQLPQGGLEPASATAA